MTVKLQGLNKAQKPETAIVDNDVSEIDPAEFLKAIATKNRDNDTSLYKISDDEWNATEAAVPDTSEVQSPSPTVDIEKFALINKISAGTLANYSFLTVMKFSNKNRGNPSRFKCPFCGSHELTPYEGKDFVQWRCDCFGDDFKRNEDLLAKTFGLDVDADKAEIYRRVKEKMPNFDKPTESIITPNVNVGMFADDTSAENNPTTDDGDISIVQQIVDDIDIANGGFEDLPVEEKRGIRDETARRLKIGAIKSWYHPKMPNTQPTTRFICRLGDDTDPPSYNAILTPAERRRVKPLRERYEKQGKKPPKWTDKSLTAGSKLIFNPTAIDDNDGLLCVTEGEFDCASIVQATNFQVAACALGGAGLFKDFEARLSKLNNPPQVIVLFDRDAKSQTGQLEAPKLVAELAEMRIAAVAKFFEDVMSDDELKIFGGKVDANEILQKRGDEFLADVINRIIDSSKVELDALKEKFAAEKSSPEFKDVSPEIYHDAKSRPKELSPEIKTVLDAVNNALDSSNVLNYVDRARVSGLVCPDCKSGSHTHGTGALKFFDKPSPHVACYKCRFGADALKLFAMKHGRDTTGKNFFETLRAAADEFGVQYDPKIFELPTRPLTVEDHMTGDKEIDDWQGECGYIQPELYAEICAAKEFLTSLTPENLTAAVACSQPTKKRIALCTYFDFASTAAYTFWATLDAAIKNATAQVKESKSGFTTTVDVDVRALATLDVKKLRKDVDRYADKLKKAHEKYQDNFQRNKQRAEHDKRVVAVKDARTQKLEELETISKQPQSDKRDNRIVELLRGVCEYNENPFNGYRVIRNTAANAKLIFSYDPILNGLTAFDEFQQAEVFLKKPPWRKSLSAGSEIFKDSDAAHVRIHLRETYDEFSNVQLVDDELTVFAHKHSFHPVKDFFRKLPQWDGKTRAETLFIDFLRVDDTPFAREVTLNWLLGAVARIFFPGCPYQTALVLHGAQGIGKSYVLERLGVNWYGVLNDSVDDPHAIDDIQNLWLVELREFKAARKADVNSLKSFIDTAEDNRRAAFARRAERVKRHVVFGITVNDDNFLNDFTGNRRFPILECKSATGDYIEGLTDEYIAQVWAEVYAKAKEMFFDADGQWLVKSLKDVGKKLELSREAKRQVEAVAEKFLRDDGVANEIKGYLDMPIPPLVIWHLLSRDERRRFFVDKHICFSGGTNELEMRRRARGGRKTVVDADVQKIFDLLKADATPKFFNRNNDMLFIYGCELRQHICAAEIRAECFAPTDKRNNISRINELLPTIEGWHAGERLQKFDPEYPDQKKVFYRDNQNEDDSSLDENQSEAPTDNFLDKGEPVNPDDLPPDMLNDDPPF